MTSRNPNHQTILKFIKPLYLACLYTIVFFSCHSQTEKKFNLDFETYNPLIFLSKDWFVWGEYDVSVDTTTIHSGKFSGKIKSQKDHNSFGAIGYRIPANYEGKSIRLDGFMKIKNIENGFGGLLLRIDDDKGKVLEFNNMKDQNIYGSKDWEKYSITLPYPKNAASIYVAGLITGKGEAWFDDFIITIDEKDIQHLKEIEKPIFKANLDTEFDLDSNVKFSKLDTDLINNLELLGKIWGFLKYYHPTIATGNYNWDYELFRILPTYIDAKNKLERDQTLLKWVKQYGKIDPCYKCQETIPSTSLKPDLDWIDEFDMDSKLIDTLNYIYKNRYQGEHFYIDYSYAANPEFLNENHYYNMSFTDDGFKLLGLFRCWNIIHYFFPNKHLTTKNWNQVLKEYIPKFINSKNKLEYETSFIRLIGEINDTHATSTIGFNNTQNLRGHYYPPFKIRYLVNKFVVSDYYNPELKGVSKIKPGDILIHINHRPIKSIIDSISPYYPASNDVAKMRDIAGDLLRSNKKEITIEYLSNNQKRQHLLPLYNEEDLNKKWYKWTNDKCYKMLEGNIGYITLEFINQEDIPVIKEAFKNVKGIIIDIRNYPSAFVPYSLGSYFVSKPTEFVKFSKFNKDNIGAFKFEDGNKIPNSNETFKGKLVVLINEDTQSQAEFTAMAFRAGNNTTVIGSTTAGADGNVSAIYLPGGLRTRISGIGVYYPDGSETQRVGIIPDIEVKPTIKGIKEGRDEVLEKAIEFINTN